MAKKGKRLMKLRRLHDITWGLMSRYVRIRDLKNGCITCGRKFSYDELQAGHFVHGNSMDFVEKNINAQCAGCNCYKHGDLGKYAIEIDKKWGSGTAEMLIAQRHNIHKFTRTELEEITETLKNKIALLMTELSTPETLK